ncbi:unnamed protein product, partial [Didymodactylos carnosus]
MLNLSSGDENDKSCTRVFTPSVCSDDAPILPKRLLLQKRRSTVADLAVSNKGQLQLILALNNPDKYPALCNKIKMNAARRKTICVLAANNQQFGE